MLTIDTLMGIICTEAISGESKMPVPRDNVHSQYYFDREAIEPCSQTMEYTSNCQYFEHGAGF